ncbi:hypothetical protein ABK040_000508 [Willaertia magna]
MLRPTHSSFPTNLTSTTSTSFLVNNNNNDRSFFNSSNNNSLRFSNAISTTTSTLNVSAIEEDIKRWKSELNTCKDPLTGTIIKDPVVLETGQLYERTSIEKWLESGNDTCPVSGKTLHSKKVFPILHFKQSINNTISHFIDNVKLHVKEWQMDNNLLKICEELIEESLQLIDKENYKYSYEELKSLQFTILMNRINVNLISEQELLNQVLKFIEKLNNYFIKIDQLKRIEKKLNDKFIKSKFYRELLNLYLQPYLENLNLNDNTTIVELDIDCKELERIFLNYLENTYNYELDNDLINNTLKFIKKENRFEYFDLLYKNNYNLKNLLQLMVDHLFIINLENKNLFLNMLNEILNEDNELTENEINNLSILTQLYKECFENEKFCKLLMEECSKLHIYDKYLFFYMKFNSDSIDPTLQQMINFQNIQFKHLELQNKKIKNLNKELIQYNEEIQNLNKNFINLNLNLEKSNNELLDLNKNLKFTQRLLLEESSDIILKKYCKQHLPNEFKNEMINIITIKTPFHLAKKGDKYFSEEFEQFGLQWYLGFNPKGDLKSKEDECAIYLYLKDLQFKNKNLNKKIQNIKINYLISNIYLDDTSFGKIEYNFTKVMGYGSFTFKQKDYLPIGAIIGNDGKIVDSNYTNVNGNQQYRFVVVMKLKDINCDEDDEL